MVFLFLILFVVGIVIFYRFVKYGTGWEMRAIHSCGYIHPFIHYRPGRCSKCGECGDWTHRVGKATLVGWEWKEEKDK